MSVDSAPVERAMTRSTLAGGAPGRPRAGNVDSVTAVTATAYAAWECRRSRWSNAQGCVMADRDTWEKAESLSKIFAAVLIPVVLGLASLFANQALERSKTKDDLLKQAIDVVFLNNTDRIAGNSKSFESRRAHRSH